MRTLLARMIVFVSSGIFITASRVKNGTCAFIEVDEVSRFVPPATYYHTNKVTSSATLSW